MAISKLDLGIEDVSKQIKVLVRLPFLSRRRDAFQVVNNRWVG